MRSCNRVLPALFVLLVLGARSLAEDTTAPKVTDVDPLPGATLAAKPGSIVVTFDEAIDPATVSTSSFRLVRSGGDGTFVDGNESEIVLASVALTSATVATMDLAGAKLPNDDYRVTVSGAPLPTGGLVAHWKLDDGASSQTAADSSGGGNDGTLGSTGGADSDDPTWQPTGGMVGDALSFDGSNDYVGFGDVLNSVTVPFSISAWVKWQGTSTGVVFACDDNSGRYYGFWLQIDSDNTFALSYGDGTGMGSLERRSKRSASTIALSTWTHIAAVVRGPTDMSLYIEGIDAGGSYSGSGGSMVHSSDPALLGYNRPNGPNPFNGSIDEVRIYDTDLTSAEVAALATMGVTDLAGNALDGEYSGSFPSGDDVAGGDFVSTLTVDAPLPEVSSITPAPDAVLAAEPTTVTVTFTKEIDAATVNEASLRLTGSGGDGTFADGNEIEIALDSASLTSGTVAVMDFTTATLADDVYQVTAGGAGGAASGLVGYWRIDEGSGQTVTDSSGNGNDGRLGPTGGVDVGDPTWLPTGGKTGGALGFDGTDDYVDAGTIPPMTLANDFTWVFWAKQDGNGGGVNRVILGNRTGGSPANSWIKFTPTQFEYFPQSQQGINYANVPADVWIHHVVVKNGTSLTYYRDGVPGGTSTISGTMGSNPFFFGGDSAGERWRGTIDDVRVYSRALSVAEIQDVMGGSGALSVIDLADNILDGEYLGGFPSGDGTAGGDFVTTFTVEATQPSVVSTSPTDTATEVDVASSIVVTFSELMNQGTTDGALFIVPAVAGVNSWLGNVLSFTPSADLSSDTAYAVTITTDATDLAGGRNLDQECQFSFTTVDTVPPTVDDITAGGAPLPGATLAASPSSIVVTFSEPIDPATVTTDTFKLVASGGDGTFGDGDEIEIALDSVTPTSATTATMDLGATELADEVYQVTVGGTPLPTSGLVARWKLDEGAPTQTVTDSSGNGNDGRLGSTGGVDVDDPTWQPAGGKISGALDFDGTDDHVILPFLTRPTQMTIAAWISTTATGNREMMGWGGGGVVGNHTAEFRLVNGNLQYGEYDGTWTRVTSGATVNSGTWRHVAATKDGDSVTLYIDGASVSTGSVPRNPNLAVWTIGCLPQNASYANYFAGLIDDVRIYDRALTANEVAVLAGITVADLAGNVLDGEYNIATFPSSGDGTAGGDFVITFTVDKPPRVESITLLDSSPTGVGTVDFAVTFDQSVTGVATSDFAIDGSGVTGTVAAVSGSGTSYTVTVTSVAGDGTLSIDLIDNDSIIDGSGIPLGGTNPGNGDFTAGEAYDIDQTPPSVVSIALADADPTSATSVNFTVTFSEDVTGVSPFEFAVATSGTSGAIFSSAPVSPDVYTITVNNVSGNGTLGLDLVDDDDIADLAGNPLGGAGSGNGSFTGDTYTIDNTAPDAPVVTGPASPTADDTPTWDWVQGASPGDGTFRYQLDGEGGAWNVTAALTYTPASALPDGLRVLYVQERDIAANWSTSGSFGVTIDTTPPVVTVDSLVTNDVTPALFGTVDDPTATIDVTVDGNSYAATNNGATWTLADNTISPPLVEGTYDVQVAATDPLGNSDTDGTTNELVIDLTAPTVTVDALTTNDDTPALTGTVDDPAAVVVVIVASQTNTATNNGDGTWTLADDTLIGVGEGTFDVQAEGTDAVGNVAYDVTLNELVVDQTGPRVSDISPAPDEMLNAEPTSIVVTCDEPIDPATVSEDAFRLVASGGDGTFGDGNEVAIAPASVALTLPSQATMDLTGAILPNDVYEVTVGVAAPSTAGLVGYWNFDEGMGGTAYDSSGLGNDGSISGASWTSGKIGGALSFDGNDCVIIPNDPTLNATASVTLAAWIRPNSWGGDERVIQKGSSDLQYMLAATWGDFVFGLSGVTGGWVPNTPPTAGQWRHVAGVYDGAEAALYYDGNLVNSRAASGNITTRSADLYIGWKGLGGWGIDYFRGLIDEVRIYNRGLSAAEIATLSGNPVPLTDLAGNALDGEYLGSLPSGDGTPGGDFVCTFTIDTTPPAEPTVAGASPTNDPTPTWTWSPGGGGNGFYRYGFTEGPWIAEDVTDTEYTPAPLGEGTYTFYVQERDDAGSWSASGTCAITIDLTPPTVTVDLLITNDMTPELTGTVNDNAASVIVTVAAQLDIPATNNGDGTWTLADGTLATLVDGTYDVQVTATDAAGNAGSDGTADELVVEATPPNVASILRADASPTNATSVDFTVAFDEDVTGVGTSDFAVAAAGTASGNVSGVAPVDARVYTVTVSGIAGDGTLRLDLVDDDSITDGIGSPLGGAGPDDYTSGEAYDIDNTPPGSPVVAGITPTYDTTPTWTWAPGGGGSGRYRYGFTEGPWLAEDVAVTQFTPGAPLAVGPYTLYVQERDDAGNWSVSGSFTVFVVEPAPPPVDPGKTPFGGGCAPGSGGGPLAPLLPLVLALLALRGRGSART